MKEFNVTGTCIPGENYMVDISGKLEQIEALIVKGKYFTINRARQYGKTTTLALLFQRLRDRYLVLRMSFEGVGAKVFETDANFVRFFLAKVKDFMELLTEQETKKNIFEVAL